MTPIDFLDTALLLTFHLKKNKQKKTLSAKHSKSKCNSAIKQSIPVITLICEQLKTHEKEQNGRGELNI